MSEDQALREGVEAAERERCRAVSERDWPALEGLLADELVHIHMNGRADTKPELMRSVRERPRTLRRGPLTVRIYGEIAIMTGPQFLDLGTGENESQVTQVWRLEAGGWRLLSFHASAENQ